MTALKVFAVIAAALFLLGLIRLGGAAEYSAQGILVWLRVGPFRVRLFPMKKEKAEKEKKRKKKEKPSKADGHESKKGGTLPLIRKLLPLVGEAAGELKRKIQIDRLLLDYTAGGSDAAKTATNFGYSSAAAGMFLPILEQNFKVKERRVRTAMDFTAKAPTVYIYAAFSARIGQLVSFALRFGGKALKIYWQNKRDMNMKKEAI